jgi:methyltransferase
MIDWITVIVLLLAALLLMAGEAALAARNERALMAGGAIEPGHDVYKTMRWAYPLCFVAMAMESVVHGRPAPRIVLTGLALFAAAKALKYWAIGTLGSRWTFRVLVLPQAPLITHGPYAFLRHPNYVAVVGELIGAAVMFGAPITGLLALLGFGSLMLKRIAVEDSALGRT